MNTPASSTVAPPSPSLLVLTPAQVEAEYGFPVNTLKYWRHVGIGPAYIKTNGGPIRYRRNAIERYLDEHTVEPEAARAA